MTIAIALKVNDGLVLAADSASTLISLLPNGDSAIMNVYNNANKVFNLLKGSPIGAVAWGAGSIGTASISTLAKDLRRRLSGDDPAHHDWKVDPKSYDILTVAERLKAFMYDEHYVPSFQKWKDKPTLGFMIGGFSTDKTMADVYKIEMSSAGCTEPVALFAENVTGATFAGDPEAVIRLMMGFSPKLPSVLARIGIPDEDVIKITQTLQTTLQAPLVIAAMPIQDAIDLAEFLVDVAIKYSRFMPNWPTVGGPIEIAAISKHEGFKWVQRKHYFSKDYNLEVLR